MPRALVVEDDFHTVALVTTLLKRLGFDALTADNVPEALNVLERQRPLDLIILDIRLPGAPGTRLLEFVRLHFPQTKVLIESAHLDSDQIALALADDTPRLIKPFSRKQFEDAVMSTGVITS